MVIGSSSRKPVVSVSDFDDTLFRMHHGVIERTVNYLQGKMVYVLTFRGTRQSQFIIDTLSDAGVNLVGVACADSRDKNPQTKLALFREIESRFVVEEVIDDDENVMMLFRNHGINVVHPNSL